MINKAIAFATKAHDGQFRKGTRLPYIFHPMEVGVIVSRMTDDPEIIAAAILHDTVEDCPGVTLDLIREEFGERVASMVYAESEDKTKSWNERKAHTLHALKEETVEGIKLIALGDKLSNVRSLHHDYEYLGEELWERFNMKDKRMQGWYYTGLCESLKSLERFPEYEEFCIMVNHVFADVIAENQIVTEE
ncbi:MAG: bifunctional (p)ppGpp synthetase/guanosine-3',5'-bis(diphosphate) 3'-pyrophosphohydrolase [Eubacterium sp.]|nr:bifunctional (p)ppGpp synthetase/guanosine-3',5'-bis(diphosphate) 3'-pyrophosphohydrolase [Eubacterium sp.]